jgi:hypothetical protein
VRGRWQPFCMFVSDQNVRLYMLPHGLVSPVVFGVD